jgi:adenylylsulfate kinase
MIYWFTGQPGAGKTSIANSLIEKLPKNTFHVDGDDLREIFNNKDYSETGRRKNIELAQSGSKVEMIGTPKLQASRNVLGNPS